MLPDSMPTNDDETEDLPKEAGAWEVVDEHVDDDPAVILADAIGADDDGEQLAEEVATLGAEGFVAPGDAGGAGLDVPTDNAASAEGAVTFTSTADAASASPGPSVSPPDLSVSEPLVPAADELDSASMTTLPLESPNSIPLAPIEADRNALAPPVELVFLPANRSSGAASSQSSSASATSAPATGLSMTRPTVLVSLLEAQVRQIVQKLMDNQVDRDTQMLEELVTRKIAAEFTHRACEEKAAYGDY